MIDPDQWRPPNTDRRPEGMPWEDWKAWQPWLLAVGTTWPEYAHDVELYTQPFPAGERDPAILRMWMRNTAKRIDAVGRRDSVHDIFEARNIAGWSAIAQLLGYRDLWLMNYPTLALGELWLITTRIDDATRATAARSGIKTWVNGEAAPR